jgi:hypothetical protein
MDRTSLTLMEQFPTLLSEIKHAGESAAALKSLLQDTSSKLETMSHRNEKGDLVLASLSDMARTRHRLQESQALLGRFDEVEQYIAGIDGIVWEDEDAWEEGAMTVKALSSLDGSSFQYIAPKVQQLKERLLDQWKNSLITSFEERNVEKSVNILRYLRLVGAEDIWHQVLAMHVSNGIKSLWPDSMNTLHPSLDTSSSTSSSSPSKPIVASFEMDFRAFGEGMEKLYGEMLQFLRACQLPECDSLFPATFADALHRSLPQIQGAVQAALKPLQGEDPHAMGLRLLAIHRAIWSSIAAAYPTSLALQRVWSQMLQPFLLGAPNWEGSLFVELLQSKLQVAAHKTPADMLRHLRLVLPVLFAHLHSSLERESMVSHGLQAVNLFAVWNKSLVALIRQMELMLRYIGRQGDQKGQNENSGKGENKDSSERDNGPERIWSKLHDTLQYVSCASSMCERMTGLEEKSQQWLTTSLTALRQSPSLDSRTAIPPTSRQDIQPLEAFVASSPQVLEEATMALQQLLLSCRQQICDAVLIPLAGVLRPWREAFALEKEKGGRKVLSDTGAAVFTDYHSPVPLDVLMPTSALQAECDFLFQLPSQLVQHEALIQAIEQKQSPLLQILFPGAQWEDIHIHIQPLTGTELSEAPESGNNHLNFAAAWMKSLTQAAGNLFLDELMLLEGLTPASAIQLLVDCKYLQSVMQSLEVVLPSNLGELPTLLSLQFNDWPFYYEKYPEAEMAREFHAFLCKLRTP